MDTEPHINNIINAFLVNVNIRPASLLQHVDYVDKEYSYYTLKKIKELYPELYQIKNYQGVIITKKEINEEIDTCEKVGNILGYPYKDDFKKILKEKLGGYKVQLNCIYLLNEEIEQTTLFVNRCIELNHLDKFNDIAKLANEYTDHIIEFDNMTIQLLYFTITSEKIYSSRYVLTYVYNNNPPNEDIIFHIGNIIYNMGIIENNEIIYNYFNYDKCLHRYIVCMYILGDILMDKYRIILPKYTYKPLKYILYGLLNIF